MFTRGAAVVLLATLPAGSDPVRADDARGAKKKQIPIPEFRAAFACRNCHPPIADQHEVSRHFDSFDNPVFQGIYYDDYLPKLHGAATPQHDELACLSCHAPMAYLAGGYHVAKAKSAEDPYGKPCRTCHLTSDGSHDDLFDSDSAEQTSPVPQESRPLWPTPRGRELTRAGVSCDFCHSITKSRGKKPGNGGYVCTPGETMYGPFRTDSYHQAYSELHTKSEFCAICHNAVNRHGVSVRATFSEWEQTAHAAEGTQCQDCHMTKTGFLVDGKPVYESGKAAFMSFGRPPKRERLHAHRFSGGDVAAQLEGALTLNFEIEEALVQPGQELTLRLIVRNDRTGHDLPTGSVELRSVWLEVGGKLGDGTLRAVASAEDGSFGVAGETDGDRALFGPDLSPGARVYRTVFKGTDGAVTLSIAEAAEIAFDNRLAAGEVREEVFRFVIPNDASGELRIEAKAYFLRYPRALTDQLGRAAAPPLPIASNSAVLKIAGG
jgi:hypothetical protein